MMNPFKFFHKQRSHRLHTVGFTLVELLVAIVISSIVVATLLSFMNNMLNSERREQAKLNAEQEIQTALDFIADDLRAAVYIYDADGIAAIRSQLPNTKTDKVPVLVFWKRTFIPKDTQVVTTNGTSTRVGCLTNISGTNTCNERDYFVYSLVTYYLIKDQDYTWSNAARVGRFELQDGIKDPTNSTKYLTNPAPGFKLFDLTLPGTIKDKMNAWRKDSTNYDLRRNRIITLVDYIDHSNVAIPLPNCEKISPNAQLVPAEGNTANPLKIYSFYACVDSAKTLAQVYLRGNALARLNQDNTYSSSQSAYFPTVSVQVKSSLILNDK